MVRDRHRSCLRRGVQEELIKYFCGGVTARAAAEISGAKTQIHVALIAFLLLRLFRAASAPGSNPKPPPQRPNKTKIPPQLELALP
jgi:hypothetical protein